MRASAHTIVESQPWITEQEQQDLVAKLDETRDWIEGKVQEQEKLSLQDDPAFSHDEVEKEMAKLQKFAKKIFGKKKPIEKKPKKVETAKEEEAATGEDGGAKADNENANDENTSQKQDSQQQEDL